MRRRIRREYTWSSGAWLQTNEVHYIYDGNLVIQERDGNNLPTVSYTRGKDLSGTLQGAGGIGGMLARTDNSQLTTQNSQPASAYYHADGNGNITCLINTNQAVVARYLYDPFGTILSQSGPLAVANLYRFSSKEAHINSGLVAYLYRLYDPNLQKWLSSDPMGEPGGNNLYGCFGNNPVNSYDPLGLAPPTALSILQSVLQNGFSDLESFSTRFAENVAQTAMSNARMSFQLLNDPLGLAYDQYQSIANLGSTLGALSADPCLQRRLAAYLMTAAGISDITFGAQMFLGSFLEPGSGLGAETIATAAEAEASQFFRGARPGQPVDFTPSPHEFRVDADGFVKPTHGVSVFDNPQSVLSKGFEPWELINESIPDELQIIQRGRDPRHFEIVPSESRMLTPEQFRELLSQIRVRL